MILFKRLNGIDSSIMREIADNANVRWEYNKIVYKQKYIGYEKGKKEDIQEIQESSKQIIGFPLIHIPQSEIDKKQD